MVKQFVKAPAPEKLKALRQHLATGEYWRVRDSAHGLRVTYGYNPGLFAVEGEAALAMGDLPAAGALYFLHGAEDESQKEAIEVFRKRCGGDPTQMALQAGLFRYWLSLPDERLRALRDEIGTEEWDRLRERFESRQKKFASPSTSQNPPAAQPLELKSVPGFAIAVLVVLLFAFIGFLTIFVFILEAIKSNYL